MSYLQDSIIIIIIDLIAETYLRLYILLLVVAEKQQKIYKNEYIIL
jgi:hypothetical protein